MQKALINFFILLFLLIGNQSFGQKVYFFTPNQDIAFFKNRLYDTNFIKNNIAYQDIYAITRQINFFHYFDNNKKYLVGSLQTNFNFEAQGGKKYSTLYHKYYVEKYKNKSNEKGQHVYPTSDEYKQSKKEIRIDMNVFDTINASAIFTSEFDPKNLEFQVMNFNEYKFLHLVGNISTPYLSNGFALHFLFNDTSYYYYQNANDIITLFKLNDSDYVKNENNQFEMLNINGIHYEWHYASNGLPNIIFRIPQILIEDEHIMEREAEFIFINYGSNNLPSSIYNGIMIYNYGGMGFIKKSYNSSIRTHLLKNIEKKDIKFTDTKLLPTSSKIYENINFNILHNTDSYKYSYSYDKNNKVKEVLHEGLGVFSHINGDKENKLSFKGVFSYSPTGILENIKYKVFNNKKYANYYIYVNYFSSY